MLFRSFRISFSLLVIYDSIISNENDILNDLNSIHSKIKFTHENEINNTINYLDLTITINLQKNVIDLGIYHKPTSNTTAIHNKSRHPFQQNLSTINSLIHRLITLPITKPNYKKEIRYIEEMAVKNGFNLKPIYKVISVIGVVVSGSVLGFFVMNVSS